MRILLTNDDGVYAPGLWYAAHALKDLGEVIVCVPDREQSGIGTAITLHHPVRASEVPFYVPGVTAYAVEGTPSDAVILALQTLIEGEVDLVVSGINQGANLGWDMFISGTVAAALQGHSRGLNAIAISVAALIDVPYRPAALLLRALVPMVQEGALEKPFLLNINLPKKPVEELEGIEVTQMARAAYLDQVQEADDIRRPYYWIARTRPNSEKSAEGSDVDTIRRNRASITPLRTDLSYDGRLDHLQEFTSALWERLKGVAALPDPWAAEGVAAPPWTGGRARALRPLRPAIPRLVCDDLDITIAFYERLGFKVDQEYKDEEGQRWEVLLRRSGMVLRYTRREKYALAEALDGHPRGVGVEVYVTTLNVERLFEEFKEAGAVADQELTKSWSGAQEFAMVDPNGYRLVFAQPAPPR